jgi:hypothetical protein
MNKQILDLYSLKIFLLLGLIVYVQPFFAPLLTQERNQVRTAEEGHGTTLECIFMYLFLGLYIQKLFFSDCGNFIVPVSASPHC